MTVKALIKLLKGHNQNAEVRLADLRCPGDTVPISIVDELVERCPNEPTIGFAVGMIPDKKKKTKKIVIF